MGTNVLVNVHGARKIVSFSFAECGEEVTLTLNFKELIDKFAAVKG